jgi:hypothetical protein
MLTTPKAPVSQSRIPIRGVDVRGFAGISVAVSVAVVMKVY